jgi:hypothetical protein
VAHGLSGQYFSTRDIYATAALTRTDPNIDFNWSTGSPMSGIPSDGFSIRWTGQIEPQFSERYTFYTYADDGTRLWINDELVVDNWYNGSVSENSGAIDLQAGVRYDIRLEYYDYTSTARVHLSWASVSTVKEIVPSARLFPTATAVTGKLLGDYFDGEDLDFYYVHRDDGPIDFDWTGTGFGSGYPYDNLYSVRWTGTVTAPVAGAYTFDTVSDDGVRLWVNGALLIDNWTSHAATEDFGTLSLSAGQKAMVRLDYQQRNGGAIISLQWSPPGASKQVIPASALSR